MDIFLKIDQCANMQVFLFQANVRWDKTLALLGWSVLNERVDSPEVLFLAQKLANTGESRIHILFSWVRLFYTGGASS